MHKQMWQNQIQYFIMHRKKKSVKKRAFSTNNAAQCCRQLYTEIADRACAPSSSDKNKPVFGESTVVIVGSYMEGKNNVVCHQSLGVAHKG